MGKEGRKAVERFCVDVFTDVCRVVSGRACMKRDGSEDGILFAQSVENAELLVPFPFVHARHELGRRHSIAGPWKPGIPG